MDDFRQNVRMDIQVQPDIREKKDFAVACGQRLRIARLAVSQDSLRQFAKDTGVDEDRLGKWELGENQVPPWYIEVLRVKFGINHDYIFAGQTCLLPHFIASQVPEPV